MTLLRRTFGALLLLACTLGWAGPKPTFVFVKIADTVAPLERGTKYEDPLNAVLKKAGLGEVTGGGSSLSAERKIEWVGVDIDLTDVPKGIALVKRTLRSLGAPQGTMLELEIDGKPVVIDIYQ